MCSLCLKDYKKALEIGNLDFHEIVIERIENFSEEELKQFSTEDLKLKEELLKKAKKELVNFFGYKQKG